MKVTVLGKYGPFPSAGGNCSGYLLEGDSTKILIDCGNGTFSQLQKYINYWEIDAIILSHLHMDHISDCFIVHYAFESAMALGKRQTPLYIYTLTEPYDTYSLLGHKDVVRTKPIDPYDNIKIGNFNFSFYPTVHSKLCCAIKAKYNNKVLVYSADTEYFAGLVDFVRGCDLFICESNFIFQDLSLGSSNHMASFQAGQLAREGQVKRLKLTHLHPEKPEDIVLSEAKAEFKDAELVSEGEVIEI